MRRANQAAPGPFSCPVAVILISMFSGLPVHLPLYQSVDPGVSALYQFDKLANHDRTFASESYEILGR